MQRFGGLSHRGLLVGFGRVLMNHATIGAIVAGLHDFNEIKSRDPDPLLALISDYRAGLSIERGSPDDEWDARREEAAKVWRPSWDRLCSDPPPATSLAGVQAALQLVHDENATGVSVELTANVTRAALAYFGRA